MKNPHNINKIIQPIFSYQLQNKELTHSEINLYKVNFLKIQKECKVLIQGVPRLMKIQRDRGKRMKDSKHRLKANI